MTTDYDVLVVGGGPGGSTAATCLARGGLRVAIFERERFPRFHVGESLLPANCPLLDRLGVHDAVRKAAFQVKYGASFRDLEGDHAHTFYFRRNGDIPDYGYQVLRAEFDEILLRHAAGQGVAVFEETPVERAEIAEGGVTLTVRPAAGASRRVTGRFLVDASGRDTFVARLLGRRDQIPNLGKVSLFAHFTGAQRFPGREEGNIRITVFDGGWFWWIPFGGDVTSVGCVLHARTVRDRAGSVEALLEEMIARCPAVAAGLAGARRISPVHRSANFSYRTTPVVGDRFVCVGDAVAFVDPIFSAGVYIAMQSAELAAQAILAAFRANRFRARHFRPYVRRLRRGVAPFLTLTHKYYQPAFLDILLRPKDILGMVEGITTVLAGGAFLHRPLGLRLRVALVFAIARINTWVRRWQGRPVESRLEW